MTTDKEVELERIKASYSNERTLLAYIRTAASVLVLAIALIKFFESDLALYGGIGITSLGLFILFFGSYRYKQERDRIIET